MGNSRDTLKDEKNQDCYETYWKVRTNMLSKLPKLRDDLTPPMIAKHAITEKPKRFYIEAGRFRRIVYDYMKHIAKEKLLEVPHCRENFTLEKHKDCYNAYIKARDILSNGKKEVMNDLKMATIARYAADHMQPKRFYMSEKHFLRCVNAHQKTKAKKRCKI